jgi:hypothetical protein
MRFYWLLLGALTVWRITHLLTFEDGPWDMLARIRQRLGRGFFQSLFDCFYCLSLWVAVVFALVLGETWKARLLLWPALSGGAILLERATSRGSDTNREAEGPPAIYYEDPYQNQEGHGHVLRQEPGGPSDRPR